MFSFALLNSQSMFISGIALILGIKLLRVFREMRKTSKKPNFYEQARAKLQASDFRLSESENYPEPQNLKPKVSHEAFDVELMTLSRQIKAEIDTKIVALQLMIADADRVLRQLGDCLPHSRNTVPSMPTPVEPEYVHILKQEEIAVDPIILQHVTEPEDNANPVDSVDLVDSGNMDNPGDPSDFHHLVVEDPFAVNDFGFDKAMRDLEQLTSSLPAFDEMLSLDYGDTPASKTHSGGLFSSSEISQDTGSTLSPLPKWDSPMSYSISDYRSVTGSEMPTSYNLDAALHDTPTDHNTLPDMPIRRKTPYTNKLLTQVPPQLDTLMTDEPVRRMGSKTLRGIGQVTDIPAVDDDEPFAPPEIPNFPPPNAHSILVESTPFAQAEESGLDKMAVRKAKRHQLQYLIEKGMSPKEIAAHLEMPVGEVELIFSLHKRLSGEAAKAVSQPLTDTPKPTGMTTRRPRIIAAENIVVTDNATEAVAPSTRKQRFKVIREQG